MRRLEHRIPPPLVALLLAVAMWGLARATPVWTLDADRRHAVAGLFLMIGIGCAAVGIGAFRRAATTVNPIQPDLASALVSTGIYRYTRNPMYVGMAAVLIAWTVFLASPCALIGPIAFVVFITRFQIIPEERVLRAKFGGAYTDYMARVRRWL